MNIVLLASADRGVRCAELLANTLRDDDTLILYTFKESPHEPPFNDRFKALSQERGIDLYQTTQLGKTDHYERLKAFSPDVIFMVGWRYLVPNKVLSLAKIGAFTFHDSLLPKYRGFSPTVWAMVNGETETGVTLFKTAEGMDEGDVLSQATVKISPEDTIKEVTEKVTLEYLNLIKAALPKMRNNQVVLTTQHHENATYTCKRIPNDNQINWHDSAKNIYNLVRAVTYPYPGAFTFIEGDRVKIWSCEHVEDNRNYVGNIPGRIIQIHPGKGVTIATGNGRVLIKDVCIDGKPTVTADQIIKSISITLG